MCSLNLCELQCIFIYGRVVQGGEMLLRGLGKTQPISLTVSAAMMKMCTHKQI